MKWSAIMVVFFQQPICTSTRCQRVDRATILLKRIYVRLTYRHNYCKNIYLKVWSLSHKIPLPPKGYSCPSGIIFGILLVILQTIIKCSFRFFSTAHVHFFYVNQIRLKATGDESETVVQSKKITYYLKESVAQS